MKSRSKINAVLTGIGIFIVILCLTGVLLNYGIVRFNYPSAERFPVRGIDISHYQGDISWKLLSGENLQFVIVKATEGGDYRDRMFYKNIDSANRVGYKVGAYHFYRLCTDNFKQADNFLGAIGNCKLAVPPTVDLEFTGNCRTNKSKAQIVSEIGVFLKVIETKTKVKTILYTTADFYDKYLAGEFPNNPIWIRNIFREPKLPDREWRLWQFANRGRLHGISTYVDIDATSSDNWIAILGAGQK